MTDSSIGGFIIGVSSIDATYADLQNRIADELGQRTDLMAPAVGMNYSPIQLAILDAIQTHQTKRFYFNEFRAAAAFSTVAGQEYYTAEDWADLASLPEIDTMSITVSGNNYTMTPRTAEYMEAISQNPAERGQPTDYCYFGEQLRFYPIPDGAYPVNVLATDPFALPVNASDSNVWTNEAERLIRAEAKMRLYRDTLIDDVGAARMSQTVIRELATLRADTMRRVSPRRVSPTSF